MRDQIEQTIRELRLDSTTPRDEAELVDVIYTELELRVGAALTRRLNTDQIDEFADLIDNDPDADADASEEWLAKNIPDYTDTVRVVWGELKAEIIARQAEISGT